jgi:hypothetical protein
MTDRDFRKESMVKDSDGCKAYNSYQVSPMRWRFIFKDEWVESLLQAYEERGKRIKELEDSRQLPIPCDGCKGQTDGYFADCECSTCVGSHWKKR